MITIKEVKIESKERDQQKGIDVGRSDVSRIATRGRASREDKKCKEKHEKQSEIRFKKKQVKQINREKFISAEVMRKLTTTGI